MARGGACPPLNSPPVWGGLFCVLGGSGGEQAFQPIFDFQAAPPQCGGEQIADFGVLPPTLGGSKVQFGVIRGGAGGTIVWNFQNQFSDDSPPEWGGARGGLICRFGGERGGALPPYSDRASYTTIMRTAIYTRSLRSRPRRNLR